MSKCCKTKLYKSSLEAVFILYDELKPTSVDTKTTKLRIKASQTNIQLKLTGFSFDISRVGSFYYATSNIVIPAPLVPNNQYYIAVNNNNWQLQLANDGTLRLLLLKYKGDIPAVPTMYLNYSRAYVNNTKPSIDPPIKTTISKGPSQATDPILVSYGKQFLDYEANSIVGNKVAYYWADNYNTSSPYNLSPAVAVAELDSTGQPVIQNNQLVYTATGGIYTAEGSVSINPKDTNNIVVITNSVNETAPETENKFGFVLAQSLDGGSSWTSNLYTSFLGLYVYSDCRILFDEYGNCWLSCLVYPDISRPDHNIGHMIALSTDKGSTFTLVVHETGPIGIGYDYPQICYGGGQLYFTADYFYDNYHELPTIGSMSVSGLGVHGSYSSFGLTSQENILFAGNPVADNNGILYVAYMSYCALIIEGDHTYSLFPSYIVSSIFNLTYDKTTGSIDVLVLAQNNTGNNSYPTAQNVRGVNSITPNSIQHDDARGILYFCYTNPGLATNADAQKYRLNWLAYNRNTNKISVPEPLVSSTSGNRFNQSMAYNQDNKLVVSWYDTANDPTDKSVEYFSATIGKADLDTININIDPKKSNIIVSDEAKKAIKKIAIEVRKKRLHKK